ERLHIFGGAYSPRYDHESLLDTARRETWEECRITFEIRETSRMLLIDESQIGFLNVSLIGIDVSKKDIENARPNREGDLTRIKFDDLEDCLKGAQLWVPAAKAVIYSWLAWDAPTSRGRRANFNGRSGQELFDSMVGSGQF